MVQEHTLSVKIPDGLLEQIDEMVATGLYGNRSDFVKAAIRAEINRVMGTRGGGQALK